MSTGGKIGAVNVPIERIHVEVTNRCNFSCEFCPDSRMTRERGFMDPGLLEGILDEVAGTGLARTVHFHVMGEPLMYPGLVDAIRYASTRGLKTSITTNGSLLTDELLEALIEAGLTSITLSLQTPDEKTFRFRGAKGVEYGEYSERVRAVARRVMSGAELELSICFLSSPLRRLIFPVMPDVSIADTSKDLKGYLQKWAGYILEGTGFESNLEGVRKRLKRVGSFKENSVEICPNVTFKTRIMGDWAVHSLNSGVKARVGFCPGISENIGILWNGDVVFCCVDYDGRTVVGNVKETSIEECIGGELMQKAVKGFARLQVVNPHCQRCMGDKNHLNAIVRQIGSIVYFKGWRKIFSKTDTREVRS